MHYLDIFTAFTPTLVLPPLTSADGALLEIDYDGSRLLIIGELHGVKENADALYSMVHHYGCKTIAIERSIRFQPFVHTVLTGTPDFTRAPKDSFSASMLSIEMAKTMYCLFKEGLVEEIAYIDPDATADIEQGLADRILALPRNRPTICILGNWHTTSKPVLEVQPPHVSALMRVRESRPASYVEYTYGRGSFYNLGTGLDHIEKNVEITKYEVIARQTHNFQLTIPVATPTYHAS